jgi:arylsulfatase A-like enzyme
MRLRLYLIIVLTLPCCAERGGGRPDIVLITIDTVRADHLSAHGYGRRTSPAMDRLAEQGVLFRHAVSQSSWTLPSVASLHTSLYPSEHGAIFAERRLSDDAETLAEALGKAGYRTVGITSHVFAGARHGLGQGFEVFDESQVSGHETVSSEALTELAVKYIEEDSRPYFLWVHYFDPHFTYVRHPEFGFANHYEGELPERIPASLLRKALRQVKRGKVFSLNDLHYVEAVYDEEIAHTDRWIGKLLEHVDLESTVVILTSDHGEYFLERGKFFHGEDVYEPLVHVPLVIGGAVPEALAGKVVERSVEIASIPKTVMELIGVKHAFEGDNLLALARGEGGKPRPVFTEGSFAWGKKPLQTAVIWEGWKLIRNHADGRHELYNIADDPEEKENLWNEEIEVKKRLRKALDRFPPRKPMSAQALKLDPETMKQLDSLGYTK